jgi:DNA-directed RNA polymerase subunit H (RpoH/RPB5)
MTSLVSQLYKSRKILLELLKRRGFDVKGYDNFSFSELRVMNANKQLDMLLTNLATNKKIYIKYHLATKIRPPYVYDYVEDLFNLEEVLTPTDDLIIIIKDKVNDTSIKLMTNLYITEKIFCMILTLKQLQFNILDHSLVPPHRILSTKEIDNIKIKYNITQNDQFPEISRFDPVAQAIGLRPDQVCEIIRGSKTAITTKYYRLCY